jgi:hypothetical protein
MKYHLEVVAQANALRRASGRLRRRAAVLTTQATGARAVAALAGRRARVGWISGGADEAVPGRAPDSARACQRCAQPIDEFDPVVAADDGDAVHVRCWRPPDPVRAPLQPFAESPMRPLEELC